MREYYLEMPMKDFMWIKLKAHEGKLIDLGLTFSILRWEFMFCVKYVQ